MLQALRKLAAVFDHQVGWDIPHNTSQISLSIPANVISDPVYFCRELHVALNMHLRFAAL